MKTNTLIKQLRTKRNWSQTQLASVSGVSQAAISLFEKHRRFPNTVILKKLADAFGVSVDFLLS